MPNAFSVDPSLPFVPRVVAMLQPWGKPRNIFINPERVIPALPNAFSVGSLASIRSQGCRNAPTLGLN
jgi:hypothetical protein